MLNCWFLNVCMNLVLALLEILVLVIGDWWLVVSGLWLVVSG